MTDCQRATCLVIPTIHSGSNACIYTLTGVSGISKNVMGVSHGNSILKDYSSGSFGCLSLTALGCSADISA